MITTTQTTRQGPLAGLRVVEVGGVGPAPFCAMLLADLGAEIIRIDRKDPSESGLPVDRQYEVMFRSRRSIALDLKTPEAIGVVTRLIRRSDILIEGFRPGVMERLGLSPDTCLALNPKLIYGRMTGWGQSGPLAKAPGHDINYIALSGALHAIGRKNGAPEVPLNLVGDFGGGAMYLAFGIMCALHESRSSGKGQVVDAGMIDGATSLMTMIYGLLAAGYWTDERGSNRLDSGAPFYGVYETKDARHIALGSNEARFYKETLKVLGLQNTDLPDQHDKAHWPQLKAIFAEVFKTRTRDEWCEAFDGTDTCFSPVLSLAEAPGNPHQIARGNFVECGGVVQPAPAPKFSRTKAGTPFPPAKIGEHTVDILKENSFNDEDIQRLQEAGAI